MNFLPLKFYVNASFINFLTSFILGIVLLKNSKSKPSNKFSLLSFAIAQWSLFYCFWLLSDNPAMSEYYLRTCMLGTFFMPSLFVHYVTLFVNKPKSVIFYAANYSLSVIFSLSVYTAIYANNPGPFLVFPLWLKTGPLFHLAIIQFGALLSYSIFTLIREIRSAKGIFKNQLRYMTTGAIIGFTGGLTNYFSWYRIPIPPYLNALVSVYVACTTYAIVKYKLWDIHILTRRWIVNTLISITIVILVYGSFMLITDIGIRFLVITFISLCITIYLPKLKTKTESAVTQILYKDKYKYQNKLRAVARIIPTIYDMEKLLKTLDSISQALDCSPCSLMLLDNITKRYTVAHSIGLNEKIKKDLSFPPEIEFIQKLKWGERPIVKEELLENDLTRERMGLIKAEVSVPILRKNELLGIINLNHKANGDVYSSEDLSVLIDIAEYLGMAIENISLNKREHHEELMTYLNNISYALSHELKNKSQVTMTTAQAILKMLPSITNVPPDLIKLAKLSEEKTTEIDKIVNEMVAYSNIQQMQGFGELDIAKTLDDSLRVTGRELEAKKIKIIKDYKESKISHGDWGQIVQAFASIIKNAAESMEEGGTLSLKITDKSELWEVSITDTGKGIPENHLKSIFEPFFTTKFDKTGLGLSIARRIVYDHAGDIKAESEEGKGTTVNIYLPKQMPEEKIKARSEIKRREDIAYDKIKTKDFKDKQEKDKQNGKA